jgi:hypothetical protein
MQLRLIRNSKCHAYKNPLSTLQSLNQTQQQISILGIL